MFQTEQARQVVAAEIRAEMARQRITAKELSSATGIATATLSRKLHAVTGLSLDDLFRIAEALDIPASRLVSGPATTKAAS